MLHFHFALSTRIGIECVSHAIRARRPQNCPLTTLGALRGAMLGKLYEARFVPRTGCHHFLPKSRSGQGKIWRFSTPSLRLASRKVPNPLGIIGNSPKCPKKVSKMIAGPGWSKGEKMGGGRQGGSQGSTGGKGSRVEDGFTGK